LETSVTLHVSISPSMQLDMPVQVMLSCHIFVLFCWNLV